MAPSSTTGPQSARAMEGASILKTVDGAQPLIRRGSGIDGITNNCRRCAKFPRCGYGPLIVRAVGRLLQPHSVVEQRNLVAQTLAVLIRDIPR